METESNDQGAWELTPEHTKMDKMFVITGNQRRAWFIRRNENHLQMYVAPHMYSWCGSVTINHICINNDAESIDINFGIVNNEEISTFGLRFPCVQKTLKRLAESETLQFALAPDDFEKEYNEVVSGVSIQIKHIKGTQHEM
jgi:hypothetical protein